jgi:general secretion pathway protein A
VFTGETTAAARKARWPLVAGGLLAGAALSAAAWQVLPHKTAPGTVQAVAAKGAIAPAASVARAAASLPRGHADEASALRSLASLWGATLPAGEPCQVAFRLDLRCHAGRGGIYELRQLDRPAVITLRDGRTTSYAVLAGMDERSVTLLADGKREKVELAALVARFTGEYTTFWKMPRAFRDNLAPGDQGADVDWLAARLAQLGGAAAPAAQHPFDARIGQLLRAFQSKQNLKADGVAGPRTYMRLNQLTGVAEPRLLAAGTGH